MEDEAVYKSDEVTVTKTLARFGTVSYPINGIGSVRIHSTSNAGCLITAGVVLLILGIGTLAGEPQRRLLGVILIIVAVVVFFSARNSTTHNLMLRTASGDQQAFQSKDKEAVESIKDAIERAVILRG